MVHHVLPSGYVALLLKKMLKVPYIVFFHGTDLALAARNAWKRKMTKKIINGAEKIIFNSEYKKRKFLSLFEDYAGKSVVSYPCPADIFLQPVSLPEIESLRSSLALEGRKVLISVGRFVEGKGFPHLIRLLPSIAEKVSDLCWVLIGEGQKKAEMMDMIQKNNLQSIVRYAGEVSNVELPKYFALANVFALLTHADEGMEEGFGLAFLEAAAGGLPVVAGRSGGVPEAVLHSETGLLVDVQNSEQVIEAIVLLLNNRDYARRLGEAARERILTEFNFKHQIESVFE
jgi:phosphatidylinositol alpha-1,6-mannosyltransferase